MSPSNDICTYINTEIYNRGSLFIAFLGGVSSFFALQRSEDERNAALQKEMLWIFSCWLCYFLSCLHTCVTICKLWSWNYVPETALISGLHLGGGEGREEEYRDVTERLRRRGRTVLPRWMKLFPAAVAERETRVFASAGKGFYWGWWLKPNMRRKWGLLRLLQNNCIFEEKKKSQNILFCLFKMTFSSAPTVSVSFTEVKMLWSLF